MAEKIKGGLQSWLSITPAQPSTFNIQETISFDANIIKNRIWYIGDPDELSQLYKQLDGEQNRNRFWAATSTAGREIRKIHTGLPAIIVDTLTDIIMTDMDDIKVPDKRKDDWEKIKEEIGEKQIAIKVIVYLRIQDTFLYSWWSQRVKEGLRGESQLTWERMADELPMIQLDYYDMLEKIADYIGKDNIIVRRFDAERFIGGDLYTDFIDALGLTYSEEYHIKSEMRNISLTRNNNEIKRILNRIPGLDAEGNAMFRQLLVEQSGYRGEDNIYSMFSEAERTAFLAKYHEGNHRIAKEYLGEEELFFPKGGKKEKWNPHDGYMMEDVILFFGSLALQMEQEIKEQKMELKEQKRQINGIRNIIKHPIGAIGRKIFSR